MTIKQIIDQQVDKGVTLYRLAKVFEVTHKTITAHAEGTAEKVNIKLAKTIYKKFSIVLDGFIEQELKD